MKTTKARGFGRQYWQLLWGYKGPSVDAGWTNETAPPYRYGHCSVRRLGPFRAAVVHGRWLSQHEGPAKVKEMLPRIDACLAIGFSPQDDILAVLAEPLHEIR